MLVFGYRPSRMQHLPITPPKPPRSNTLNGATRRPTNSFPNLRRMQFLCKSTMRATALISPEQSRECPDLMSQINGTLSHSRKSGKVYLVRDLHKEDENTLVAQLVVLQLPDNFCLFQD